MSHSPHTSISALSPTRERGREGERERDAEITPRLRPSLQESFGWLHLKDHYAQNSGWLTTNPLRLKPLWTLRAQCLNPVLLDRQARWLRGGPAVYEAVMSKGEFFPFKNTIIRIHNNMVEHRRLGGCVRCCLYYWSIV